MHVALFELRSGGHHTPYIRLISRYLLDKGHRVTLITDSAFANEDALPTDRGLHIVRKPFPSTSNAVNAQPIRLILDQVTRTRQMRLAFATGSEIDCDVLHLLLLDQYYLPLWTASKIQSVGFPVVGTVHRDAFLGDSNGLGSRITSKVLNEGLLRGPLEAITVHADVMRNRFIEAIESATSKNTWTIPAPTPESILSGSEEDFRGDLGLPLEKDIILFFGELRHEKGPDLLAELARHVERPVVVLYAGQPVDFSEDEILSWVAGASDTVEILTNLGHIPDDEVDKYLAAVDALVLPYRRKRGISGPLRRAAMVGTPVIGPKDTDIGDIIERHCLGATFESSNVESFEEALVSVLDRGAGRAEALKTYAASQHWKETGRALLRIFHTCVE